MSTLFRAAAAFDGHRHLGATDVLVDEGRIVEVRPGGLAALAGARGSTNGIEVVDASFLSPGFTDAHVHPIQGGLERLRCDLSELSTREEFLAAVRAYADAYPEREWILGGGWAMPAFPGGTPLATDLDAVVPDRPVFLPNRDHHGAWVNSRALEIAGVTRDTPDPPDGRIERGRRRTPERHPARGCDLAGLTPSAAHHRCGLPGGAARRPDVPALARRHRLAGRHRRLLLRHGRSRVDVLGRRGQR